MARRGCKSTVFKQTQIKVWVVYPYVNIYMYLLFFHINPWFCPLNPDVPSVNQTGLKDHSEMEVIYKLEIVHCHFWFLEGTWIHHIPYPLVNIQKAIENGHRNSWFSHSKWWFSSSLCWWLTNTPLKNHGELVSWGPMEFPTEWTKIIQMIQTTNQIPYIEHVAHLSCRRDSKVFAAGPVGQWCDKKSLETSTRPKFRFPVR